MTPRHPLGTAEAPPRLCREGGSRYGSKASCAELSPASTLHPNRRTQRDTCPVSLGCTGLLSAQVGWELPHDRNFPRTVPPARSRWSKSSTETRAPREAPPRCTHACYSPLHPRRLQPL